MPNIQILKVWNELSPQNRFVALGSTGILIILFWVFIKVATHQAESLLFSGLEPSVAGEITAELDAMGVAYSLRGSAIYVPESERDRLRLDLARQGLPAATSTGYELLDDLNGFSTTSDMFDAAYWRAKEGEMARTIMAMPGVKSVRVHLGVTRQSAFRRASTQKTASVTIQAPSGLSDDQARSIQYLTALAVADLQPQNVAVIETSRGLLAGPGSQANSGSALDTVGRQAELENAVRSLLEAHVGIGNARVTVAMDIDQQAVAQTERLIDPDTRQIASRKSTEERERLDNNGASGAITVASELPDGDAEPVAADDPRVLRSKTEEDVTFTGTQIERVTQTAAGTLRRLSVAVLVNERTVTDADGNVSAAPRTEQEIDTLRALVASAAGIQPDRGDQLTLSTLPFEAIEIPDIGSPSLVDKFIMPNAVYLAQLGFLGLMCLILGLFVVKPLLSPKKRKKSKDGDEEEVEAQPQIPQDAAELLTMLAEESPEDAAAILDAWFEEDETENQAA